MKTGDIVDDEGLGRGMIVYFDVEEFPVCAFPENPDMVVCDEEILKLVVNIKDAGS